MTPMTLTPTTEHETGLVASLTQLADLSGQCNRTNAPDGLAAFEYGSMYEYVLRNGRFWTPAPHAYRQNRPRECFNNAIVDAVTHDLRYVEGFATSINLGFPIHHAWAADENGNVIDTTWPDSGTAYLGVEFDPLEAFEAREKGGTILDNWPDGFPLFRKEVTT